MPDPHSPIPWFRRQCLLALLFAGIFLASALPTRLSAQDTSEHRPLYELRTDNNEFYRGYILKSQSDSLHFETLGGVALKLHVSRIRELRPTGSIPQDDGSGTVVDSRGTGTPEYEPELLDKPASSLFAMPTGYPIPAGEVHLGLYELFFGSCTVGIADYVDLSVGTFVLPGAVFDPLFLGAKFSPVHGPAGALAVGGGMVSVDDDAFYVFYGIGTLSLGKAWLSLGYSSWQSDASFDDDSFGTLNIGADLPVSRKTRLMTEIWIPLLEEGSGGVMIGVGARFETEIGNIDIGFYFPSDQQGRYLVFLPWLGGTFIL